MSFRELQIEVYYYVPVDISSQASILYLQSKDDLKTAAGTVKHICAL